MRPILTCSLSVAATVAGLLGQSSMLTLEIGSLQTPLGVLQETRLGRSLAEQQGNSWSTWLQRVPADQRDRLAGLLEGVERVFAKVDVEADGRVACRALVRAPGAADACLEFLTVVEAGAAGLGVEKVDADSVRLGMRIDMSGDVEPWASDLVWPEQAIAKDARMRLDLDFLQVLRLVTAIGAAVDPDPEAARRLGAVMDGLAASGPNRWRYGCEVRAVDGRIAVDMTTDAGPWLSALGRYVLQLLPSYVFEEPAAAWGVASYDLSYILPVLEAVHQISPMEGLDPEKTVTENIQQAHGIDLEAVAAAFEGSYAAVTEPGAALEMGATFVFGLRDRDVVQNALGKLIEELGMKQAVALRRYEGFDCRQLSVGPIVIRWSVPGDALLVSFGGPLARDQFEASLEQAAALRDGGKVPLPPLPPGLVSASPSTIAVAAMDMAAYGDDAAGAIDDADRDALEAMASVGLGRVDVVVFEVDGQQVLRLLL
jgi:hypothetical protein